MKRILLVIILIISYSNLFSQYEIDSLDFENFDFENDSTFIRLDKEIEESQKIFEYSKGYFPKSLDILRRWFFDFGIGSIWDQAPGIFSKSFYPTKFGFSGKSQDDDELETREKFSNEESDEGDKFDVTNYSTFRLSFVYPIYIGYLGLGIGIDNVKGCLYSVDRTKSFLGYDNKPVGFKEISTIILDETHFNLNANFMLPIYGGLIQSKESMGSFYYLSFAYDYNHAILTDASQVIQIANHKNEIRYSNGNDYQYLFKEDELKTLNKNREYLSLGIGVIGSGGGLDFKFDFISKFSITSILNDANWNQNIYYFSMGFSLDSLVSSLVAALTPAQKKPAVKKKK